MTASTESMALLESQVMHKAGFFSSCFSVRRCDRFIGRSFLMKPFKKLPGASEYGV